MFHSITRERKYEEDRQNTTIRIVMMYSSINIISEQIKVDEMGGTQNTYARDEKFIKNLI
jgi:hypothetical protein